MAFAFCPKIFANNLSSGPVVVQVHLLPWVSLPSGQELDLIDEQSGEPDPIRDGTIATSPVPALCCSPPYGVVAATMYTLALCTGLCDGVRHTRRGYRVDEPRLPTGFLYHISKHSPTRLFYAAIPFPLSKLELAFVDGHPRSTRHALYQIGEVPTNLSLVFV